MARFVTYITVDGDKIRCMTEDEFKKAKADGDDSVDGSFWDEWVWQFADSKEQAIAQHMTKMDEWHANPDKETY